MRFVDGVKVRIFMTAMAFGSILSATASATVDTAQNLVVQQLMRQIISQFQTGTPNPLLYGIEVWNTISLQTGGTGISIPLVNLGNVNNITVNEGTPLPTGTLYSITATHTNGTSTWVLGWSTLTGKV